MEKMKKGNIITALSVYSNRVSSCVAAVSDGAGPDIIGLGKSDGKFMGGAGVLDIDDLSKAMLNAVKSAQEEAKAASTRVFVSISGGAIKGERSRGMVKLSQRGEEISVRNIKKAFEVAEAAPVNIEREIIHSIPQDFTVDGQDGIKDPIGLYGVKLEVETLLISAYVPFLQNIVKCVNLAGFETEDIVFSGVAVSRCLFPSGKNYGQGAILLEIDSNFTALSVFFDGILRGMDIHPASVIADGALETLKERIDKMRCHKPISKIILSGGAYVHEDFIEKADSVFGIPSQMAYARDVRGSARDINNPAHITSIGLAAYGLDMKRENLARGKRKAGFLGKATRRVGDFLDEYF